MQKSCALQSSSVRIALQKIRYVVGAIFLALCIFFASSIIQSFSLFTLIASAPDTTATDALYTFVLLIWSQWVDIGTPTLLINAASALLIGTNVALLWYYFEEMGGISKRIKAVGLLGTLVGLIGAGCAACGSLSIIPLLTFLGGVGFLNALPLYGNEISLIGIALLGISIALQVRAIKSPYDN